MEKGNTKKSHSNHHNTPTSPPKNGVDPRNPHEEQKPEIVTAATNSTSHGLPTTNLPSSAQDDALSIDEKNNTLVESDQEKNAGRHNTR